MDFKKMKKREINNTNFKALYNSIIKNIRKRFILDLN